MSYKRDSLTLPRSLSNIYMRREVRRAHSSWISLERWLGDLKIISAFTPDFP